MIFKVEKGKDFFEINPEVKSLEKMPECTSRDLSWICLTFDYQTPLRNIPMDQRKEVAAKMVGFRVEKDTDRLDKNARNVINGKIPRVNEAVDEFMKIQYDEEQELLIGYKEQISQAIDLMKKKNKSEKEWGLSDKAVKMLPTLLSAKKELEKQLGMREERGDSDSDNEPLSTLDLLHEES